MANYKVFETKESWADFRAGLFTASEVYKLMTDPKKKDEVLSAGAKTYVMERAAEKLAPKEPEYYNSAMEHGNETEPLAALRVAKELGKDVDSDDFIYTSEGGFVFFFDEELDLGGTPDLIIRDDKMIVELKCPLSKTHLKYLLLQDADDVKTTLPEYYGQMQLNMHLTGMDKALFVSYDDRFFNEAHHYHSVYIPKDDEYISKLLMRAHHAKQYKESLIEILNQKTN